MLYLLCRLEPFRCFRSRQKMYQTVQKAKLNEREVLSPFLFAIYIFNPVHYIQLFASLFYIGCVQAITLNHDVLPPIWGYYRKNPERKYSRGGVDWFKFIFAMMPKRRWVFVLSSKLPFIEINSFFNFRFKKKKNTMKRFLCEKNAGRKIFNRFFLRVNKCLNVCTFEKNVDANWIDSQCQTFELVCKLMSLG